MSDSFFEALKILENIENTEKNKYEYRLYYDSKSGAPLFYSMEGEHQGDYLVIDKQTYDSGKYNLVVVDKQIKPLELKNIRKLIPSNQGTPCNPSNVMIVDTASTYHWQIKLFDSE